jgi:carbonic anhydrase
MPHDPQQALLRLKEGNLRFARDAPLRPWPAAPQRQALASAQQPIAHVLTCADSRVGPETVFDQSLGDLFVTRVAGNVLDDLVIGTIELSLDALDIPLVVVLGHSCCAAIAKALGDQGAGRIDHLRALLQPAIDRAAAMPGELYTNVIRENVLLRRDFLRECEPIVAPRWRQGRLLVIGALYDLASGVVTWLD